MKYELVALRVVIEGKKYVKGDKKAILDDNKLSKKLLDAAYAQGFIKPQGCKAKTSIDVQKHYKAEVAKKDKAETDAEVKADNK